MLDDDSGDDEDTESGPMSSGLRMNWLTYRAEYIKTNGCPRTDVDELLALGAIRSIYWLALGQGETALATEIGDWWKECAPLHGLGEVIR
ncbi:hypothetical protein EHZ82_06685 [Aeromonas hydrophila]|nr:hypothetical protein EHZ82_06685 [Aeromonas hydrophila]